MNKTQVGLNTFNEISKQKYDIASIAMIKSFKIIKWLGFSA